MDKQNVDMQDLTGCNRSARRREDTVEVRCRKCDEAAALSPFAVGDSEPRGSENVSHRQNPSKGVV